MLKAKYQILFKLLFCVTLALQEDILISTPDDQHCSAGKWFLSVPNNERSYRFRFDQLLTLNVRLILTK